MSLFPRLKKRVTGLLQRHYRWVLNSLPENERKAHLDAMRGAAAQQALESMRKAQGVDFLPETYCLTRFMLQHLDENTRRQNHLEEQWFRRPVRYEADRDELFTVSGR